METFEAIESYREIEFSNSWPNIKEVSMKARAQSQEVSKFYAKEQVLAWIKMAYNIGFKEGVRSVEASNDKFEDLFKEALKMHK